MKRLLLLSLAAAVCMASSCLGRKCWVCTVTQTTPEGIVYQRTHQELVCGKTKRQIRAYEAAGTFVVPRTVGDTSWWQETVCQ